MRHRLATLFAKKAYTADISETIEVNLSEPISQINILLKTQSQGYASGSSSGYAMPAKAITKVELVDGADVLYSLSGPEAQALDFYHNRVVTPHETRFMDNGWSQCVININFGRFLFDRELAFDPKKFSNPQLKITVDLSVACCNSDNARLTVTAWCFHDDPPSPTGFLMQKEIKSWSNASAHEYTEMPLDHPYRKILVRSQVAGTIVSSAISRIKFTIDNDKKILCDELSDEIITAMMTQTPPYREWVLMTGNTAGGYYFMTACQRGRVVAIPWTTAWAANQECVAYDGAGGRFVLDMGSAVNVQADCWGWCPNGVIEIPLGMGKNIEDWLPVEGIQSLKADITAGTSSGTCEILAQQHRKYA